MHLNFRCVVFVMYRRCPLVSSMGGMTVRGLKSSPQPSSEPERLSVRCRHPRILAPLHMVTIPAAFGLQSSRQWVPAPMLQAPECKAVVLLCVLNSTAFFHQEVYSSRLLLLLFQRVVRLFLNGPA
jgi:hypothetical protein